jgi:hypothetical protein
MADNDDLPPESGATRAQQRAKSQLDIYSTAELYALRKLIDERLPSLREVNMERELVAQLAIVKNLQETTLTDFDIPANQRAQVAGQVANILAKLGVLQVELYDSERMKEIEQILIDTLNELPIESQERFLASYRLKLEKMDA